MIGRMLFIALGSFFITMVYIADARPLIPVQDATPADWNADAFWHENWGDSGVHKGIDIFGAEGTPVHAARSGLVIYRGTVPRGGNILLILGGGWTVHYYAHLQSHTTHLLSYVSQGEQIGFVGTTGNAAGKEPHLHYSVMDLIPNVGQSTAGEQGWKRLFYVDPSTYLGQSTNN